MSSSLDVFKELLKSIDTDAKSNNPLGKALTVEREGTKIILPENMSYQAAMEVLDKKRREDEQVVAVYEIIETHPLDGAYAMMEVLKKIYGWPTAQPTPGFFGDKPPVLKDIDIGYKKKAQILWGRFAVPGISGFLSTGATMSDSGRQVFVLQGEVKQKHREEIKAIALEIRNYIAEKSIYKGQAIRLRTNDNGQMSVDVPPQFFLDVARVNEDELTFSDSVRTQVEVNLFTPIEKTQACRDAKIPLKRGVLLEGPYGTGKTLTAYVTAKKCIENNWTFIYLDRVTGVKEALIFARQYAPAVLFSEDIDRALDGERNMSVDDILNTIDGVDSKNLDIITILTTNHVEKIEKAMMRPGRLDAIITVLPPDAKAAQKLMRIYSGNLIPMTEDLTAASTELAGQIPAVIREVVERSKLYAISRLQPEETLKLSGSDLLNAALSMKNHLALMKPDAKKDTLEQQFGSALVSLVHEGMNGMREKINQVHTQIDEVHAHVVD